MNIPNIITIGMYEVSSGFLILVIEIYAFEYRISDASIRLQCGMYLYLKEGFNQRGGRVFANSNILGLLIL